MTPALYSHPSSIVDLEAMARRVLARDRGDQADGTDRLYPGIFDGDRQVCVATQGRLEAVLRDRSAHHHLVVGAQGLEDAPSTAALDLMADEVATMPEAAPSITKLAEAEIAMGPLEATPDIVGMIDTCGSDQGSIETLVAMLVSTMKVGTTAMPKAPAEMSGCGDTNEGEADA